MASQTNPLTLPKTTPPASGANKDQRLADLRRQLSDINSDVASPVGSRSSRGRRNRNHNKVLAPPANGTGGLANPSVLPRLAETKPVRLQLGLNLDVGLELKARLREDISLTLFQ